jgi:hypothetical protein
VVAISSLDDLQRPIQIVTATGQRRRHPLGYCRQKLPPQRRQRRHIPIGRASVATKIQLQQRLRWRESASFLVMVQAPSCRCPNHSHFWPNYTANSKKIPRFLAFNMNALTLSPRFLAFNMNALTLSPRFLAFNMNALTLSPRFLALQHERIDPKPEISRPQHERIDPKPEIFWLRASRPSPATSQDRPPTRPGFAFPRRAAAGSTESAGSGRSGPHRRRRSHSGGRA